MLKEILNIVRNEGYISRSQLAARLNTTSAVIDDALDRLDKMGYLTKEETGSDCSVTCAKCPFAKTCGKEIVTTFKLSEKGS